MINQLNQLLFLLGSFWLLSILWFFRTTRAMLFWIYLWQLKDYHWGRFLDHFRTDKGKKLFLAPLPILKIVLVIYAYFLSLTDMTIWQLYAIWITVLSILYLLESYKFIREVFSRTLKTPILTIKTIALVIAMFIVQSVFLYVSFQNQQSYMYWFAFYLLLFDIFLPLTTALIIFFVHFFTVIFFRNRIIRLAKQKRSKFKDLLVIGITGSYGKTSTKEFLYKILLSKFKVLTTKENKNSEAGISQTILQDLTKEHQVFIAEMGAYNRGGIKLLCDIIKPKIGIITGVNEQHLTTFGSMENLLSAEGGKELIESLPEDGVIFLNEKNRYCREIYQKIKIRKYLYGKEAKLFSEENILGAMAVAKELGMTGSEIESVCQSMKDDIPGMATKQGVNGITIIDSTYSANPDGVIAHLDYIKTLRRDQGKLIIVMPCLIELGKASKEVHKRIGEKIGEVCDLAIITSRERFKDIKEGAEKSASNCKVLYAANKKEILSTVKPYLDKGNIVLLEGRLEQPIINLLLKN
ncbi:MAG: hypothetical protein A3H01_01510 [Candidatus Wildermuthbacteria bacterium RIFCSPLOWO2_12_FULL_40_9]|uniref:Mur ligase central domain-containing protein n=2 Tax=Candidatus Wildermuthiibacteriota TaxID=1817923 RepID=A0A1G2RC25_9BACT|nr:MAG: hypothetical protein A3F15_02480 [Candidatus Wildermuthbacteria bacterium RIFCSPHIGHO2_12_FULL_40_12]OHA76895.1 MAG: hypothetical protein A3H01_01510 [Candidatus Wildermuthbacteria bacterium RIFCSPLOWO2_12_FULL_40_9]